jgi:anti-anti-sigma factor
MTDQLAQMSSERRADQVTLRLSGEIDLSNAEDLQPRIDQLVGDCRAVVVDLGAVEFIDSRGLRLLNRLAATLAANGATLELIAPPGCVARDVLDLRRPGRARHHADERRDPRAGRLSPRRRRVVRGHRLAGAGCSLGVPGTEGWARLPPSE